MIVHTAFQALLNVLRKSIGSHGDNGDIRIFAFQRPDGHGRFVAIHNWHSHVHKNCVVISDRGFREFCNTLFPVFNPIQFQLEDGKQLSCNLPVQLVILRQQNVLPAKLRQDPAFRIGGVFSGSAGKRFEGVK